ncbi:MAG TPA: hypothetical protein VGB02_16990 [Pyrinomonadaceae bacterium]|jgi:hypothetical protein
MMFRLLCVTLIDFRTNPNLRGRLLIEPPVFVSSLENCRREAENALNRKRRRKMGEVIETTEKHSSWILELPDEIAGKEGYVEGSKVILTFRNGKIETQILPPTSEKTKEDVNRIINKYDKAFEELKRLGD